MGKRLVAAVVATMCATVAGAFASDVADKKRPAWEWTPEERVAARFDPATVRARGAADAVSGDASVADSVTVDGASHPELLMGWEMMGALFPIQEARRAEVHARLRGHIERLGWKPEEFWSIAEATAADYLDAVRAMLNDRRRSAAGFNPLTDARELAACALRAETLKKLRRQLGPNFDRLLYEGVAPSISITSRGLTPGAAAHMLFVERGCR